MNSKDTHPTSKHYFFKNVSLETGFKYLDNEVVATQTDLFCVEINDTIIVSISDNATAPSTAIDAKGRLMLPAFQDMHVHLDKTLYGLPWQALSPKRKTVADMIAYEQEIIPVLLQTSTSRAEQLINLLQSYGTSFVRTHFNVDLTSGLKSLENLQLALERKQQSLSAELVAFPQHGLYYTDSLALMREAAQLDAVNFIGGLDPYSIDGSIEKVLDDTVSMALDNNKGIDIHLHDGGQKGIDTINYLADKALENPSLRGKTYVSHAFVLAELEQKEVQKIAEKLAAAQVGIVSSIPFSDAVMPIPTLVNNGVKVLVGNDNVQDYWSTFGTGSMLQKANLMASLYHWVTEFDLSRTLRFATNNVLPLNNKGEMQWPKAGDDANFVLVDASCSAEAVSRMSKVHTLVNKGVVIY